MEAEDKRSVLLARGLGREKRISQEGSFRLVQAEGTNCLSKAGFVEGRAHGKLYGVVARLSGAHGCEDEPGKVSWGMLSKV